uniref:Uncharacterized protein n=1 Tax=Triticum urartu TaxID=4572 RepID=A0A8R7U5Z2_TRIUA
MHEAPHKMSHCRGTARGLSDFRKCLGSLWPKFDHCLTDAWSAKEWCMSIVTCI